MAESTATVILKLLFDTKGERVLFAEAGKDFVDFLFQILCLRVGTVFSLVGEQYRMGSLPNLYESIENLDNSYIQPNITKDKFLNPVSDSPINPLLALNAASPPTVKKNVYTCTCPRYNTAYYSDDSLAVCPNCKKQMTTVLSYVDPPAAVDQVSGGVVKDLVTYMVMDDLVVTPLSTISSITLLNKFNVKDVTALEEKVVHFGLDEAVKVLKASLHSTKVLTDVFFKGIQIKIEEPK